MKMNNLRRLYFLSSRHPWKLCFGDGRRQLFTPASLGLNTFSDARKKIKANITNLEEFKMKMEKISQKESKDVVLLLDVRQMAAVTETDSDLNTLIGLLEKYTDQEDKLPFHNFHITPEIFRLLHHLNKPKEAIAVAEIPKIYSEMNLFSSVLVFLDLLYKNYMYEDVIKYYERVQPLYPERPGATMLLYFASCYKLNTKESFEKAMAIEKAMTIESSLRKVKNHLRRRAVAILAHFALKQDLPLFACELLFRVRDFELTSNLMAMAFARAKRFADSLQVLDQGFGRGFFMLEEAMSYIKKEMADSEEYSEKFLELCNKYKNFVRDETIEMSLFSPVTLQVVGDKERVRDRPANFTFQNFRRSQQAPRYQPTFCKPVTQFSFS